VQLHADLTRKVLVDSDRLPWVASPSGGVERRMLERDGDEVARATSLVRFAAGSAFPEHEHAGGEEFLVLDGVFSDEEGDFPAGWYVRNPPGTRHSPASSAGCTILVKLRQMDLSDRTAVRIDTRAAPPEALAQGVGEIPLFQAASERVRILVLEPGAGLTLEEVGGSELFVIEGAGRVGDDLCRAGAWLRAPDGESLRIQSENGCRLYVKTGHLVAPRAADVA
jgi:anti-sigma factor ChrR (cupin superfamily)